MLKFLHPIRLLLVFLSLLGFVALLVGFQRDDTTVVETKQALGERLFSDTILSGDESISCASCHRPQFGFADTAAFSAGVRGQRGKRNTPGVTNLSGRPMLFWDGRAGSLEEQALVPIANPEEMDLPIEKAVARLNASSFYRNAFQHIFKEEPNQNNLSSALAVFQRTLETVNSPYDRYIDGDDEAISAAAKRGRMLFIGKANCNTCHSGEDFTADRFKSIGLYNGQELNDKGRYDITGDSSQLGLFKVPGLRNVAVTAPYMHNGMFKTLKEVVEYYNDPDTFVKNGINRDLALDKPLQLSVQEVDDLVAFLETLTDDRFRK